MSRDDIILNLKNYFDIRELVGKAVYNTYRERSWRFLDRDILYVLLILRINLGKPITINNWHTGGKFSQRGLRTNVQSIFRKMFTRNKLYLSAHVLGKAVDLDVKGMTSIEVRKWIEDNSYLFEGVKIRLEDLKGGKPINWVHIDVIWESHNPKIYRFNV